MGELGSTARRGGGDHRTRGQLHKAPTDEGISRVSPLREGSEHEAGVVGPCLEILCRVNRDLSPSREDRGTDLLDEDALAADLTDRHPASPVPRCLDRKEPDLPAGWPETASDRLGLVEREGT